MSRTRAFARVSVLAPLCCAGLLVVSAHCGDSTGRTRVSFLVTARSERVEFDTSLGWHVRVHSARAAIGPVRWYEGPPLTGDRLWQRLSPVSVAYAHPGHYVPGEALADITERQSVDLLASAGVTLGRATGVSGTSRSAQLQLSPQQMGLMGDVAALGGATLRMRGTATRMGTSVVFDAAPRDEVAVTGSVAEGELEGDSTRWELVVSLQTWVDRVDFSMLAEGNGAVRTFPADGQGANALSRGVASAAAYRLRRAP